MRKEILARRTEWAILVLGLAGIPAIWLAFAGGTSPMDYWRLLSSNLINEWRLFSSGAGNVSDIRDTVVYLAALLWFFLAPFVSLAQFSRCLGRPSSVWERWAFRMFAFVAVAGCLAVVVLQAASWVPNYRREYFSPRVLVQLFVAFGSIVGALVPWLRAFRRHGEDPTEYLLMGAYIGGVAMGAAFLYHILEPTAVVAGFTCVVYAASLRRRIRLSSR